MESLIAESGNTETEQQSTTKIINFKHLLLSIIGTVIFILIRLYIQTTTDDVDGVQRDLLGRRLENQICEQTAVDKIGFGPGGRDNCRPGLFCYDGKCIDNPTKEGHRCRNIVRMNDKMENNCPRGMRCQKDPNCTQDRKCKIVCA